MKVQSNSSSSINQILSKALKSDIHKSIVSRYVNTCLRESCELLVNYARHNHKYRDDTGKLSNAISFFVNKREPIEGRSADIFINTDGSKPTDNNSSIAPYGNYQLYGTGIYGPNHRMIRPVNGSLLHWRTKNMKFFHPKMRIHGRYLSEDEWVKEEVKGIKPDNFLYKAYRAKWNYIVRSIWIKKAKEWRSFNGFR